MIWKHKKHINLKKKLIFFKNIFKTQCQTNYGWTSLSSAFVIAQPQLLFPYNTP